MPMPSRPPITPSPASKPKPKEVSKEEIRFLKAKLDVALIEQLGRVPPNTSSIFIVEIEKVKDKPYNEALDHIMNVAKEIVNRETSREALKVKPKQPMARRVIEPFRPEEKEERFAVQGVRPTYPPSAPLAPEEQAFPRHPTKDENVRLWDSFQFKLQEIGLNAYEYQDEWNEYIFGSNHKSWDHLMKRYDFFVDSIIKGKPLPPLWKWKGIPIPYGLEELLSLNPDQKIKDLIIWATSNEISNSNFRREQPRVDRVIRLMTSWGFPVSIEDVREALIQGYTKLKGTNLKYDQWFLNITLQDLEELLAAYRIKED